jgi:tetratricopeptide (TPR) repeat protein
MRSYIFLAAILLMAAHPCTAQDLVDFNKLTFNSELERSLLTDYVSKKDVDPFLLFMANGALLNDKAITDAHKRFYDHLATMQNEKMASRKNDKKARFIYDDIHKTFLKKYEEKNRFEEIFHNGYYNCVSASALYALVFEKLDIPYTIKEEPTHVYLVAYPETERIKVETTSPIGGFQTIDESFKQQFVKMLKDQKLITAQEYASQPVGVLFDKFYFANQQDITLTNLVGIQYLNDAVFFYEEGKYKEAFAQLEKSYLFFPSEKARYLLMTFCSSAFHELKQKDTVHAGYLGRMARFTNYGVTADMIQGEFAQVVQELLFQQGKKEDLHRYYETLTRSLADSVLLREIDFIYQYESGRLFHNQARHKEALPFFEAALRLKPEHHDANTAVISALANTLVSNSDNQAITNLLESYSAKYPSLSQYNTFNNMLATVYLIQFGTEYDFERAANGEKYREKFEAFLKKHSDLQTNSGLVGQAYATAAVYYFRKGQTTKSKTYIEKGLQYAPNNHELLSRKRMIK